MRCIILYLNDAEIAEGFGETETEAKADAMEQLPSIYTGIDESDLTFEYHPE